MNYVNCNVGARKEIHVITKSHIFQNLGRVEYWGKNPQENIVTR
jgi:hypothetical protein